MHPRSSLLVVTGARQTGLSDRSADGPIGLAEDPPPMLRPDPDPATLIARHDDAHDALDGLFFGALEALTALDVPEAARVWRALREAVIAHAAAEEACFAGTLDDAFEPPRGASARIFVPEHRSLERLLQAGAATLDALAAPEPGRPLRARVVRSLEPLLRVHHLLSHHHARERDIIYPWVLPRLDAAARRCLVEGLESSLPAR